MIKALRRNELLGLKESEKTLQRRRGNEKERKAFKFLKIGVSGKAKSWKSVSQARISFLIISP